MISNSPECSNSIDPRIQQRPRILYMYRKVDDYLRDTLIKKHLWASNPLSFNDPFDCTIPILNSATPAEATACVEALLDIGKFSPEHQTKARQEAEKGKIIYSDRIEIAWQKTMKTRGVICFTERPDNLLMWAHYASKHEGICLGFEGMSDRLDIQQVRYSNTQPLKLVDLLPPKDLEATKVQLTSKSLHWCYEREWRFICSIEDASCHDNSWRQIEFKPKELRRVIFGCRMSVERRQEVMLILKEWPTKVYFYEVQPHATRFALNLRRLKE